MALERSVSVRSPPEQCNSLFVEAQEPKDCAGFHMQCHLLCLAGLPPFSPLENYWLSCRVRLSPGRIRLSDSGWNAVIEPIAVVSTDTTAAGTGGSARGTATSDGSDILVTRCSILVVVTRSTTSQYS